MSEYLDTPSEEFPGVWAYLGLDQSVQLARIQKLWRRMRAEGLTWMKKMAIQGVLLGLSVAQGYSFLVMIGGRIAPIFVIDYPRITTAIIFWPVVWRCLIGVLTCRILRWVVQQMVSVTEDKGMTIHK